MRLPFVLARHSLPGHPTRMRFSAVLFDFDGATDVALSKITSSATPKTFLKLAGSDSSGIQIEGSPGAKERISLANGVTQDAVTVR